MQLIRELIKVDNITVNYGSLVALKGASLTVNSDDFIGVIGPNGGGKTSFVKAILGLMDVSKGDVFKSKGLKIGYLPQVSTIDKSFPMSVLKVVCSGVDLPARKVESKAIELLKMAGVEGKVNQLIGSLSGGEMQRVLLCRALIQDPQLLILDEPTTYVDANFSHNFYDLLHKLNQNIAIIMVSHDLGMITQHVKTIACVNKTFHYHLSNVIDEHQLKLYDCPMKLVSHGNIPHTVLCNH